jgi:hypothetical protein
MTLQQRRRHGHSSAAAFLIVLSLCALALDAEAQSSTTAPPFSAENFAQPLATRPKIRWWLPLAPLRRDEIERELQDIAAAGFGGVEILGTPLTPAAAPQTYGFATPAWNDAMREILLGAKALGLTVDFTIGAVYPAATPALEPDDRATSQELVYGSVEIEGEFDGPLPEPIIPSPSGVNDRRLVGVSAARITDDSHAGSIVLDPDSLTEITAQVRAGKLRWHAPTTGRWKIIASYARSAGHIVADITSSPSRVVDHFSAAGTEAIIRLWDTKLLTPDVRTLIRESGSEVFEDSLHLSGFTLWTEQLLEEFERRRGYSLRPYLPVIYIGHLNEFFYGIRSNPGAEVTIETPAAFELANGEGRRIRNDYYQVLSELYTEHHLKPLRTWFNSQGLRYRVQTSYGQSLEGTAAASAVDVPETESFQLADMIDGYRVQAAVAHLAGQRIYSTECCAVMAGAHALGWPQTLRHIHRGFAGGVNQAVLHGYSYLDAPTAKWPGWFPFDQMFSENYGRQPTWKQARDFTEYLGREQLVLRQGAAKIDVAIYRLSYWDYGRGGRGKLQGRPEYFNDPALGRAGYTYEFLSPALLARGDVTVADGALAPQGPAYRALVLDQQREIPVTALQRIMDAAKQGLPVVVIGEPPRQEPFRVSTQRDAHVRELGERLMRIKGVHSIAERSELPALLASIGLEPVVKPSVPADLLSVRRVDGNGSFFWFFNPSDAVLDTQVSLAANGAAVVLDAWSGCSRPLTLPKPAGNRTDLPLRLAPGESRIVLFSTAPLAASTDERCANRAVQATRTLELDRWSLKVESWLPGAKASDVKREVIDVEEAKLQPWHEIPQLEDASGIGTYRTEVGLPRFNGGNARLRLGKVSDTARVFVNGQRAYGLNQHTLEVEVGPYLRAGENEILVEVATTLRNRMRVIDDQQRSRPRQGYGLLGPAALELSASP